MPADRPLTEDQRAYLCAFETALYARTGRERRIALAAKEQLLLGVLRNAGLPTGPRVRTDRRAAYHPKAA
jgi:hypothetical protein